MSWEDREQGKYREVKGKVKGDIGGTWNSPRVIMEGQEEKVAGKVQQKVGDAKKLVNK